MEQHPMEKLIKDVKIGLSHEVGAALSKYEIY